VRNRNAQADERTARVAKRSARVKERTAQVAKKPARVKRKTASSDIKIRNKKFQLSDRFD